MFILNCKRISVLSSTFKSNTLNRGVFSIRNYIAFERCSANKACINKTNHFYGKPSKYVSCNFSFASQNSWQIPALIPYRTFKTSEPRQFHPVVWLIFKPILKLAAVLTGRGFRKWWKDLPKNKKKYFKEQITTNKRKIAIAVSSVLLLFLAYYISHLEETPITKRKRFMAFNNSQLQVINQYELEKIMEEVGNKILPPNHPATRRVQYVVHMIVNANLDIKEISDKNFGIAVIDSPIENAFVLPVGYVFVFSGMINLCSNDDQLGTILAHEIAHCVMNHGAENVSFTHLLDVLSIFLIAAIWAVLPSDSISLLIHWLHSKLLEILLKLPYSRKIETEADYVGLQLAAKACFDVRESSAFWSKMGFLQNTFGKAPDIEFLSTHPSHEKRSEYLDSMMDKALKLRVSCNCPRLGHRDPRNDVEAVSKALDIARKQFFENNTKPDSMFHLG